MSAVKISERTYALAERLFVAGYWGSDSSDDKLAQMALDAAEAFERAAAKRGRK